MLTEKLKKLSKKELKMIVNEIRAGSVQYKAEELQALYEAAVAGGVGADDLRAIETMCAQSLSAKDNQQLTSEINAQPSPDGNAGAIVQESDAQIHRRPGSHSDAHQRTARFQAVGHRQDAPQHEQDDNSQDAGDDGDVGKRSKKRRSKFLKRRKTEVLQDGYDYSAQEQQQDQDDEDEASYPILRFLADFYKTLGWLFFAVFPAIAGYIALNFLREQQMLIVVIFIITSFIGIMLLISFYAKSESIALRISTERHLRRLVRQSENYNRRGNL